MEYIEREDAVVWKDIVGYEGLYKVSNDGRIKNSKGKLKALSIKKDKNTNYKEVSLWKDGKNKRCLVHRLVAKAFIQNPNKYKIINHKDEDGTNNCISNLEWCDHKYNARYRKYTEKPKAEYVWIHKATGKKKSGSKWYNSDNKNHRLHRSKTPIRLANAMAEQWGGTV